MFKGIKQRLQRSGRKFRDASQIGVTGVFILSQLLIPFLVAQPVRADGDDSPTECLDATAGVIGGIGGEDNDASGDLVTYDAGAGNVVDGVCIKSGDDAFGDKKHSDVLDNGTYEDSCYEVTGVGTQEVTVERNGEGPDCKEISHIDVLFSEAPEIDFCDPSQKPGGMDIAEWLATNQFESSDCFEINSIQECGSLDVVFTKNLTPYDYTFRYALGNETPDLANWQGDGPVPVIFGENEGGGSVELTYYIVGPEKDYFTGFGMPNIWDGNGITVEVDTDCEAPEIDFCDPSQKPGGMDIAEWLAANQVDGSDCFEIDIVKECGSLNVIVTKYPTSDGWAPYEAVYTTDGTVVYPANSFPANFAEDENSGSVDVTWYLVGPEGDYLEGFELPNFWDGEGETIEVTTDCEDPVDFCDPAQKPGGMDIAEWLEANEVNGADCFDYEIVQRCGYLDVTLTEYPGQKNGWVYEAVYTTDGSIVLPENAEVFPAIFDEEENGGSVDVTWYIVGPEGDYLEGFDLPNFWDGEGETITVDTDCEPDVKVIKYHDLNQNGEFDEGEPKLPDWKFFLDECELEVSIISLESQGLYGDCLLSLSLNGEQTSYTAQILLDYCYGGHDYCEKTDENGEAEFKNLEPFTLYRLSEKLKDGWVQTNIQCDYTNRGNQDAEGIPISYNSHLIFVAPNSDVTCEVGNYRQAELEITKSNDATDALLPGQSVEFTITVTNPETSATLTDVQVYDLMPEGLSYVEGSAQIDGSDATLNEPYGTSDPAEWDLGTMEPGDVRELTYTAVVDQDTAPGTYTNVAWTDGCEEVVGRYLNGLVEVNVYEEEPRCDRTQREVLGNVDRECVEEKPESELFSRFYDYDKDKEPVEEPNCDPFVESSVTVAAVLGESETFVLAVTGAPAILMPVAGLTIAAIALATVVPNRKWRRLFGKFGSFSRSAAMSFMALVLSISMFANVSAASFSRLTVADLANQTNVNSVELPYSVAQTDSTAYTVDLDVDGPGSNDMTDQDMDSGSKTKSFAIAMPVDGTYTISVALNGGTPDVQTVTRDTNAPAEVVYEGVQRDGNTYTLNFNASGADKVQIFASTSQSFATSQDNLVGEVDGSASSFVYTAPDSDQRYFALVAVDNAGNRSPVVGDTGSAVTDGVAFVDSGVVSDAAATDDQTADDEEGQEQAATDENGDGNTDEDEDDNSGLIVTIIVLAGLAALLYTYFVRKPNEASN